MKLSCVPAVLYTPTCCCYCNIIFSLSILETRISYGASSTALPRRTAEVEMMLLPSNSTRALHVAHANLLRMQIVMQTVDFIFRRRNPSFLEGDGGRREGWV